MVQSCVAKDLRAPGLTSSGEGLLTGCLPQRTDFPKEDDSHPPRSPPQMDMEPLRWFRRQRCLLPTLDFILAWWENQLPLAVH